MLKTLIGTTDPDNYTQYLNEKIDTVVNLFKKIILKFQYHRFLNHQANIIACVQSSAYFLMRTELIFHSACLSLVLNPKKN